MERSGGALSYYSQYILVIIVHKLSNCVSFEFLFKLHFQRKKCTSIWPRLTLWFSFSKWNRLNSFFVLYLKCFLIHIGLCGCVRNIARKSGSDFYRKKHFFKRQKTTNISQIHCGFVLTSLFIFAIFTQNFYRKWSTGKP